MSKHNRYKRIVTPDSHDESAPCGCRRVKPGQVWHQVVWCPEHPTDGDCLGPWSPSVHAPRDDRDEDDYDGRQYDEMDDDDCEEDAYEEALQNCGQVPSGGCLKAGSEQCDFECPFRDEMYGLEEEES